MAMQYFAQINKSMVMIDTIKLYAINTGAFMVTCCDWIEPTLKIMLLVATIGYTLHKWYLLKKSKKK